MFPIRDNLVAKEIAPVTATLIALNVLLYIWDRGWSLSLSATSLVFTDLAVRPIEIVRVLAGRGDSNDLVTLFTSIFLHGNVVHLAGNMMFLLTFGPNVEVALGSWRYALFYLFWGVMASAAHILVMPDSTAAALGASGAIGGVLGCYFLIFPGSRITLWIFPFVWTTFGLAAWLLLGLWFLFQIFVPQAGVANWAHAGGFLTGMLTVLIAGGRSRLLKNTQFTVEPDAEYA